MLHSCNEFSIGYVPADHQYGNCYDALNALNLIRNGVQYAKDWNKRIFSFYIFGSFS